MLCATSSSEAASVPIPFSLHPILHLAWPVFGIDCSCSGGFETQIGLWQISHQGGESWVGQATCEQPTGIP